MAIANKNIVIFGFGSQGRAQALNLRDSGCQITVALRADSKNTSLAKAENLRATTDLAKAAQAADIAVLLIPDEAQKEVYENFLEKNLAKNATLIFAHGFNIHFDLIKTRPDLDVILVAPKIPGPLLRKEFLERGNVPCLFAVHQDVSGHAEETARSYAEKVCGTTHNLIKSTFAEETVTNLFSEQVILSGGLTALIKASFETLTAAGYSPQVAYLECVEKLRFFAPIILEEGLAALYEKVSPAAAYGDLTRGPQIIDASVRARMKKILGEIESGAFAREFLKESEGGHARLESLTKAAREHAIEKIKRG